jgi:predicted transposase YdaD
LLNAGWQPRHVEMMQRLQRLRPVFVDMLGAILAPLAPDVRVPDALLEIRNMLATRAEAWEQTLQQRVREGEQRAEQRGEQRGRQEGEAAILRRQLERRFGALPDWARDRIAAADSAALEEWGLRVLDAGSLDDVLA